MNGARDRGHRLLAALAGLTGRSCHELVALARGLDVDPTPAESQASTLNNDGYPLQLSVGLSSGGRSFRLVGDPAADDPSPQRRLERGRRVVAHWLAGRDDGRFGRQAELLFDHQLPATAADLAALRSGALWLATDLDRRGLGLYLSGRWGSNVGRWRRVRRWLRAAGVESPASLLHRVERVGRLASVGLEGVPGGELRLKVYWRMVGACRLDELLIPVLSDGPQRAFLETLLADGSIRRSGLLLCLSVSPGGSEWVDGKIDLCAHCMPATAERWSARLAALSDRLGLVESGLSSVLASGAAEVAFVGHGLSQSGDSRLNVYLKAAA